MFASRSALRSQQACPCSMRNMSLTQGYVKQADLASGFEAVQAIACWGRLHASVMQSLISS